MRFFLDNDVDVDVARMLRAHGHEAWTAHEAGLADDTDDDLTVYASKHRAVLLTHDREFSQRRRRNVVGQHVWLHCVELEAAEVLKDNLPELTTTLRYQPDVFVELTKNRLKLSFGWK